MTIEKGCTFIFGPHEGLEFELPKSGQWLIGRDSDSELYLEDDLISRQHVKLEFAADSIELMDLGSTNGTFVNGSRVRQCVLECGDYIVVGKHMLKIVAKESLSKSGIGVNTPALIRQFLSQGKAGAELARNADLSAVPLTGLVQLLGVVKFTGNALVQGNARATLSFESGQLLSATINDELHLNPEQSLEKILRWTDGHVELVELQADEKQSEHFKETTEKLVEQLVVEQKKAQELWAGLPEADKALTISQPLPLRLSELSGSELDVFQYAHDYGVIGKMLERSSLKEYDFLEALKFLLEKGVLKLST